MTRQETILTCASYDGFHCDHWHFTLWAPCCYCRTEEDSDDARCSGKPSDPR